MKFHVEQIFASAIFPRFMLSPYQNAFWPVATMFRLQTLSTVLRVLQQVTEREIQVAIVTSNTEFLRSTHTTAASLLEGW